MISLVKSGDALSCSFELLAACCCNRFDSSVFSPNVLTNDNGSPRVASPGGGLVFGVQGIFRGRRASPGSGLVFGVQVERRLDFAGPHSRSGGLLGLLLGTADKGRNAVGAGKLKGRTQLPARDTRPATIQPRGHVSTRCCGSKYRVLRAIHFVMRRGRLQQYASTIQPLRFTSRRSPSVKRS